MPLDSSFNVSRGIFISLGIRSSLFLLDLQLVESFTIYTDYITLRDEGVFVNIPHHSEYFIGFILLGKYYYNIDALLAIPACTIQQCNPTVKFFSDGFGYFFVFSLEDEELNRLTVTIPYIVDDYTHDKQYAAPEQYTLPIMEYQVTRRNNDDITIHNQSS